jgi:nicotinamidase/pyrazinamidase
VKKMNALILVDFQNDFMPGGALPVPSGDAVAPVANQLQAHFPIVVATQDWHPPNHCSFAVNHPGHRPGDLIQLHGLSQILWPEHCVQNTPGAEFASSLSLTRIAQVFQKGVDPDIDSYSGFFDNGHRRATGLEVYLRERNVTDVYVVGLATDYCVKFTALDAIALGFTTFVIEDACRGVDLESGDVSKAIAEMRQAGAQVILSGQLEC